MRKLTLALLVLFVTAGIARAQFTNVQTLGATGGNASVDTAAFQAAVNATGAGVILIPPAPSCYQVTGLDLVGKTGLIFMGEGPASCIAVAGSAGGNWLDLSGAQGIVFRDVTITGSAAAVPATLFFWAREAGGPVVHDLTFDDVQIAAFSSVAHLYGYGFARLNIRGSVWTQLENGPSLADVSQRTTVIRLDAENSANLSSANSTIATGQQTASSATIEGSWFIDAPAGFGGGHQDNNTAFDCVTCGVSVMTGGGIESLGGYDLVLWWFAEGLSFHGVAFAASDGSVNTSFFVEIGGGTNGNLLFDNDLFSVPVNGGAPFAIAAPMSRTTSPVVGFLKIVNPEIGGTYSGEHLLSVDFSCTTSTAFAGTWLEDAEIEAPSMDAVVCGAGASGGLVASDTFRGVTQIIAPAGVVPFPSTHWGPP